MVASYRRDKKVGWRKKSPQSGRAQPQRKQATGEGKSENDSRYKKSKVHGKMCRQSLQTTADAWAASKEVEHVQGPNTSSLYLANIGSGGSWVRGKRGHGLVVGKWENLFWHSCLGSFRGNVLLGWHTTQKKQGCVGTTRCMPWGIEREREHQHCNR